MRSAAALLATWRVRSAYGAVASRKRRSAARRTPGRCRRSRDGSSAPTTSRRRRGSSDRPQRPMPVSSFRWTRTPSGISVVANGELEPRVARLGDLAAREVGPMTRMRATRELGAQRERLGDGRDAERPRARAERRAPRRPRRARSRRPSRPPRAARRRARAGACARCAGPRRGRWSAQSGASPSPSVPLWTSRSQSSKSGSTKTVRPSSSSSSPFASSERTA